MDRLNGTIAELTIAIEQEAHKRPEVLRLMTHPGVGPITALAFVLVIGSPDRFACGKQIGSYLGLIPCEDSSANRQRLGHITKQGSSLVPFLLAESAQAVVRWDSDWRRRYAHLSMRRDRRIAKVAMARRLAISLYWMWRKGYDYQQSLQFGSHAGEPGLQPWCEVNHRPLDWASRSLTRKFEVVIMVERAIGEMVGSDRVPPERLHASLRRR